MDADIKLMVKQNTEEAKYFFNTNPEAYRALREAVEGKDGAWLKSWSLEHARQNDDFFGSLFIMELDAVEWDEIVNEEKENVARPKKR